MIIPATVSGPGPRIATAWAASGGIDSRLGFPETQIGSTEGGEGRYRHFENGSVYWHSETDAVLFEELTLCYKDESEKLPTEQLKRFVTGIRKPKFKLTDWLASDPIGLDPQEDPEAVAWVGNEGWVILDEIIRLLIQRYNARYENPPDDGMEVSPRDIHFDDIDRRSYEGERIARVSVTA